MCWFCGEYLVSRIFFTIIVIFLIIICCGGCCRDYGERIEGCMTACCYSIIYKKATIVPLVVAEEVLTSNPVTIRVNEMSTNPVKVVWE